CTPNARSVTPIWRWSLQSDLAVSSAGSCSWGRTSMPIRSVRTMTTGYCGWRSPWPRRPSRARSRSRPEARAETERPSTPDRPASSADTRQVRTMTIATVGGEMRRATATDVVLDLEQMWLGTAVDEVFRDTVGRSVDEYLTDRSAVGLACSEPDRTSAW